MPISRLPDIAEKIACTQMKGDICRFVLSTIMVLGHNPETHNPEYPQPGKTQPGKLQPGRDTT